jgi:hypothetical protein
MTCGIAPKYTSRSSSKEARVCFEIIGQIAPYIYPDPVVRGPGLVQAFA